MLRSGFDRLTQRKPIQDPKGFRNPSGLRHALIRMVKPQTRPTNRDGVRRCGEVNRQR